MGGRPSGSTVWSHWTDARFLAGRSVLIAKADARFLNGGRSVLVAILGGRSVPEWWMLGPDGTPGRTLGLRTRTNAQSIIVPWASVFGWLSVRRSVLLMHTFSTIKRMTWAAGSCVFPYGARSCWYTSPPSPSIIPLCGGVGGRVIVMPKQAFRGGEFRPICLRPLGAALLNVRFISGRPVRVAWSLFSRTFAWTLTLDGQSCLVKWMDVQPWHSTRTGVLVLSARSVYAGGTLEVKWSGRLNGRVLAEAGRPIETLPGFSSSNTKSLGSSSQSSRRRHLHPNTRRHYLSQHRLPSAAVQASAGTLTTAAHRRSPTLTFFSFPRAREAASAKPAAAKRSPPDL
ncbi:hypothetical protein LR48_Vigan02g262600 [Vigna angularis]|uniref:Uncharacterized protein n=1 Tax=Phaseolus angularis TaxID=3914 RepID=A0A0L9U146_PHAAN|nr:hypothetical protein LR48_Vigan02g262600 [Vigna angularis]